jgi:hypothetical protein
MHHGGKRRVLRVRVERATRNEIQMQGMDLFIEDSGAMLFEPSITF